MTIKEKTILNNMEILEITREEAEELWAFDNDEIDNEEEIGRASCRERV